MCFNQTENRTLKQKKYKKIFQIKITKTSSLQIPSNNILSIVILGDFLTDLVTIIFLQIWTKEMLSIKNKTNCLDCHLQWEMTVFHQLKTRSNPLHRNMKNRDFHQTFPPSNLYFMILLWLIMLHVWVLQDQKKILICQSLKTKFN